MHDAGPAAVAGGLGDAEAHGRQRADDDQFDDELRGAPGARGGGLSGMRA
jgi:hypothetical protein